ncbi:ArsR/SmtB family transcription factor [Pelotomaculum propionicicum]|uniref:ArsR/SmtB family transcription factor n=1 Tax=Pelotomaculum propionicicum TaxID=258475 RepID=UPI003B770E05
MSPGKVNDCCEVFCFDREKVARLRGEVEVTAGMSRLFKALADDTRIKIVYALSREELCVCDVACILGTNVATASHHLRLLRNMGLARQRKEGKFVYYSLGDKNLGALIDSALKYLEEGRI